MSVTDKRLWLIGGTSESADLAKAIAAAGLPCTVTVTTAAARSLYPLDPNLHVWVGRLARDRTESFCLERGIVAILDASHPHAVEISRLAIETAAARQLPYLRFERPGVDVPDEASGAIALDSFDTLLAGNYLHQQRVLLTVGYKPLALFRHWHDRATLFARILPSVASLEAAIASGFSSARLIALRPPVAAALEKALWQQWDISLVVTKASGAAGGEAIKRQVAAELGIPLIVIARPVVEYPQQTSNLEAALEFCQTHLN